MKPSLRFLLSLFVSLVVVTAMSLPAFAQRGGGSRGAGAPGEDEAQEEQNHDPAAGLRFRNLGPAVGGGRVTAVTGVVGQPSVYYTGAAAGGVFKSIDGGLSWKPVFEKEKVASIGAIAVAPSNPSLVWVGTGEANFRNDVSTGKGVYMSPDGGASWQFKGLESVGQISSVVINPTNPDIVFVGALGHQWGPNAERGVFRTTDGGKHWEKVLYIDDKTGVADMIMVPGNPQVLFAGMWQASRTPWMMESGGPNSGIYRSVDGGSTWKKLTVGLPGGSLGRIGLAAAPSNPEHIYALIEAKNGALWDSRDLGDHWRMVSDAKKVIVRGFYFTHLVVSPRDENKLYFLTYDILSSDDGGKTSYIAARGVHPDNHSMWIDPENPNRIIAGNDGGVYLSADAGKTWRYLDNLPIEQFYMVATDDKRPYMLCGGLQDNNGWCGPSNSLNRGPQSGADWFTVVGGDGEYVVPAPKSSIVYADSQNGSVQRLDISNGMSRSIRPYLFGIGNMPPSKLKYRFNWTSPIAVSPQDGNTVYLGGNVLFRSTDSGGHWEPASPDLTRNDKSKQESSGGKIELDLSGAETFDTILSIAVSPTDPKVIWIGTDDGLVQVTQDGGQHWENATKNVKVPEWGRLQQIEVSPFSPGTAYAAFDLHEVENNKPYVFKTHDFGKTWTDISAGLPTEDPARVVRENPNHKGWLVVGTETGLFYSHDDGGHWTPLKSNFPTVPIYDIKFEKNEHDLIVATHGRGLFLLDDIRPLEEADATAQAADLKLFSVAPATRWYTWNKRGFSLGGFAAPNPPNGAVISYWLKDRVRVTPEQRRLRQTPVKITVTDESGKLVRTFYGSSNQGFNRATWDMRYNDAARLTVRPDTTQPEEEEGFFPRGGPAVAPGNYKVTVTVNGKSETQAVTVASDPRFDIPAENFREQTKIALELRDQLSALNRALNRLSNLRRQVSTLQTLLAPPEEVEVSATSGEANSYAPVLKAASDLDKKLRTYEEPIYNLEAADENARLHFLSRFYDRVQGIYRQVTGPYGQPPNEIVKEEIGEVQKELTAQLTAFNALLESDVAGFNKLALQHGANTLFAGPPIQIRPGDTGSATAAGGSDDDDDGENP